MHRGSRNKLSNIKEIQMLKQQLNDMVNIKNVKLCEGEILDLSQKLDKLIVSCYVGKEIVLDCHIELKATPGGPVQPNKGR
jgi:hypothetical protein